MKKARVIALYLPQFHPIPENDKWWGKGFTEWTNVGKAKNLYPGHYQPHVPADLGYYDLRVEETRIKQAQLAEEYGVEGFMYWHYWFGNGKRLLERPFNEVLKSGKPNFPFALAWANESWKGFAHGLKKRNVLIEQTYPGEDDFINHFYTILPALKDKRYITINSKPIFMIYRPYELPNPQKFIQLWQKLAKENGLEGIHFIAHQNTLHINEEKQQIKKLIDLGFDSVNIVRIGTKKASLFHRLINKTLHKTFNFPTIRNYKNYLKHFTNEHDKQLEVIPSLVPNWDHTPRSGKYGLVFHGSTPSLFAKNVKDTLDKVIEKPYENRIIFIKSWNEWAEGNYMEPDLKWGLQYLEVLKNEILN